MSRKKEMATVSVAGNAGRRHLQHVAADRAAAADRQSRDSFCLYIQMTVAELLPRPISICEIDKEKGALRMVYRVTGEKTGTEAVFRAESGRTDPGDRTTGKWIPIRRSKG